MQQQEKGTSQPDPKWEGFAITQTHLAGNVESVNIVALASCLSLSLMIAFLFLCCVQQETEDLDKVHNQVLQ